MIISLKKVSLLALSIVLGGLFMVPSSASAVPSGYTLVWSDEFSGSSLDTSKWGYQNGTWSGSNVQNCYTAANTVVGGGSLHITARHEPGYACFSQTRDFTSGFVQTKDKHSWTYGYFEVRAKLPDSDSTWPAFWMSPQSNTYGSWPRSGEIDVFEAKGHNLSNVYADAHWGESSSNKRHSKGTGTLSTITDWHTYGVKWTEGKLEYYIDGSLYHTITNFSAPNATVDPGPFNQPFYLRLNMAVGGDYLTAPYNDANNSTAQLPAVMEVDYARVYAANTPSPSPPPATPTPQPEQPTTTTPSAPAAETSASTPTITEPTEMTTATPTPDEETSTATSTVSESLTPTEPTTQKNTPLQPDSTQSPSNTTRRILGISFGIGVPSIMSFGIFWYFKKTRIT